MSTWTHHRARVARLSQERGPDDPDLVDAKRDLAAVKLEERIRAFVEGAPAPRPEDCRRLASLLERRASA